MAYTVPMAGKLKIWARALKQDAHAIYLAARDPRTPWYAKALALCVAAYALSPIDLIPDFIPVLGYLDDVVIVPLGIVAAASMIPAEVLTDARATAKEAAARPTSRAGLIAIAGLWVASAALLGWFCYRWLAG